MPHTWRTHPRTYGKDSRACRVCNNTHGLIRKYNLMSNKFNEYYVENDQNMNSPLIFTDTLFNDYLIYIFKRKYILIREFPSMKIKIPLNPTLDNHNEELCSLCISEDKKNLFVLEQIVIKYI